MSDPEYCLDIARRVALGPECLMSPNGKHAGRNIGVYTVQGTDESRDGTIRFCRYCENLYAEP